MNLIDANLPTEPAAVAPGGTQAIPEVGAPFAEVLEGLTGIALEPANSAQPTEPAEATPQASSPLPVRAPLAPGIVVGAPLAVQPNALGGVLDARAGDERPTADTPGEPSGPATSEAPSLAGSPDSVLVPDAGTKPVRTHDSSTDGGPSDGSAEAVAATLATPVVGSKMPEKIRTISSQASDAQAGNAAAASRPSAGAVIDAGAARNGNDLPGGSPVMKPPVTDPAVQSPATDPAIKSPVADAARSMAAQPGSAPAPDAAQSAANRELFERRLKALGARREVDSGEPLHPGAHQAARAADSAGGAGVVSRAPAQPAQHVLNQNGPWADALAPRILQLATAQGGRMLVELHPAELGSLEIRVELDRDDLRITVNTQHPLARDLADQHALRLRELLGGQGFANVSVDVEQRESSRDGSHRGPEAPGRAAVQASEDGADASISRTLATSLVDAYV